MSFLGAAFLMALPLVAVPVAIHLYRGRQRDVIPWGAMQFLTTAVAKGRSLERLEELLLMFLRVAAIAAIVFALARPLIRSSWLGDGADGEVILIIDNSLSTAREVDGDPIFATIKDQAAAAVDAASSNESVQIVTAAAAEWATAEGVVADSAGRRRLREIIDGLTSTLGSADLLECIRAAVHLEAPPGLSRRRIVVIADDQASSWQASSDGLWRQLAATCESADFPMTIDVRAVAQPSAIDNLSLAKIDAVRKLVRPGEELAVSAEIVNLGDAPSPASEAQWLVDGEVVHTTPLPALDAGGTAAVSAALPLRTRGSFVVSCRIARGDQLSLDQSRSLVVEVASHMPILIVQRAPMSDRAIPAGQLISAALGYADGQPQTWNSIYRPEVIEPAALAGHDLGAFRAIVIDNVGEVDEATLKRLDEFVRAGGGLWISLGDAIGREQFNRRWYADGTGLSPVKLAAIDAINDAENAGATIHPPARDHPATMQLANTTQLDIDEARLTQRWTFADRGRSARALSPVLESGDGRPLIVEHFAGQGRVLVQALPMGLEWSNLPLLKSYVVMIHDGLDYLTTPTTARFNLSPGSPILVSIAADGGASEATLTTPLGGDVALRPSQRGLAPAFRYSQTRLPGLYRIRWTEADGVAHDLPYHVARDARESDLTPLDSADRTKLTAWGVNFDGAAAAPRGAAVPTSRREPIWGALLIGLIALLTAELLLSSWLARQRHGIPLTSAT